MDEADFLRMLKESTDANERFAAQEGLTCLRSRRTYEPLARIASTHPNVDVAATACYTLSFMCDPATAGPLLEVFRLLHIAPRVRAQAAEGLGNASGYADRRRSTFKDAARALIERLRDPSPEVRFWCCFGLGQMRARQAVPELTRVAAEDDTFCPGWWFVREEAADALQWIENKCGPERETLGWTEAGPRVPPGFSLDGIPVRE